jgi:hypothetical protein
MAGLEPIRFGLLQGDGGYPKRTNTAIIDFFESENGPSKYQFVCATTEYQMEFTLDETGKYYEDSKIVFSSFDKIVEELALWDQIGKITSFKTFANRQKFRIQELDKKLDLILIPEVSDNYTQWFKNSATYLKQCNGLSTIISVDDFASLELVLNT